MIKRSTYFAMLSSYYAIKRGYKKVGPEIKENEVLIRTLKSRMTYRNLTQEKLEKIVFHHPTITSLIDYVIIDEKNRSLIRGK